MHNALRQKKEENINPQKHIWNNDIHIFFLIVYIYFQ